LTETWDLLNQLWFSLSGWNKVGSGTSEINPPGQLHQQGTGLSSVGRTKTLASGLPSEYTIEVRLKITQAFPSLRWTYEFYDGEHRIVLQIWNNKIRSTYGIDFQDIICQNEQNIFYIWRFVINSKENEIKVYRDFEYLGIFTRLEDDASNDGKIWTRAMFYLEGYEDYIKIKSGLHPPSLHDKGSKYSFIISKLHPYSALVFLKEKYQAPIFIKDKEYNAFISLKNKYKGNVRKKYYYRGRVQLQ